MTVYNIIDFIINNQMYYKDFVTRSTKESNAIEGNSLSIGETQIILFEPEQQMNFNNIKPREIKEAINHKKAMDYIFNYIKSEKPFNSDFIKDINEIISDELDFCGGPYRTENVLITGSDHIPPQYSEVPDLMENLIYRINLTNDKLTMEDISAFHLEFEKIHPFNNGNGRTGRLLINYLLLRQNDYPLVIKNSDRNNYINMLNDNNILGLTDMFKKYQSEEQYRIDFILNQELDLDQEEDYDM